MELAKPVLNTNDQFMGVITEPASLIASATHLKRTILYDNSTTSTYAGSTSYKAQSTPPRQSQSSTIGNFKDKIRFNHKN